MKFKSLIGFAGALALAPVVALATTVTPAGPNQFLIAYDNVDSNVDLGDLNLSLSPVGVGTAFGVVSGVDGSLSFGVFGDAGLVGTTGSIDVNLIFDHPGEHVFSGTFAGQPLVFHEMEGDFIARLDAPFAGPGDVLDFAFNFENFHPGDQFQVNVAGVIPLPASVFMLLAGLGGLGIISRRRKSAMA